MDKSGSKNKICILCRKIINSKNLRRHEKNVHNIEIKNTERERENASIECNDCAKHFSSRRAFIAHLKRIHNFQFPKKQKQNSNEGWKIIQEEDLLKNFILPQSYSYKIRNKSRGTIISVKFEVESVDEVNTWLQEFQQINFINLTKTGGCHSVKSSNMPLRVRYKCTHNVYSKSKDIHGKNTNCPFTMYVRLVVKVECTCEIIFRNSHNHETMCAESLMWHKPTEEVKEKFIRLFEAGHLPSKAMQLYITELKEKFKENFNWCASDRALLPNTGWVYRQFYNVFKKTYGSAHGNAILDNVQTKIDEYNETRGGATYVKMTRIENDFIIVILTAFMKRVLSEVRQSSKIIFVDSAGSVERFGKKVFLLMTDSCAGGLPVGVAITTCETVDIFSRVLESYKSLVDDSDNGDSVERPAVIITDDCAATRHCFRLHFPNSTLLLCSYHILQAAWRFLWNRDTDADIANCDRRRLMNHITRMMNAENEDRYNECLWSATNEKYEKFVSYVKNLDARKKDWVLFYRKRLKIPALLLRRNTGDNRREEGFRVLKERILEKSKAFCPQQLLAFILNDFENYYREKLIRVADGRPPPYLPLTSKNYREFYFNTVDEGEHIVTNAKKGTSCTVYVDMATCTCPVGFGGRYCKHQDFISKNKSLPQFIDDDVAPRTENERIKLCDIARGSAQNIADESLSSMFVVATATTTTASDTDDKFE